ncbi:MAG: NADH-quinone oxidoreductase subunit C [Bryobacteraceae bacterium]
MTQAEFSGPGPLLPEIRPLARAAITETTGEVRVRLEEASSREEIAAALLERGCRFASVFAEDRRAAEGCFYLYDVVEQPGDPRYLLISYRIAPEQPRFPSISVLTPAANWMEREIQDWFGLHAEGHPNPRRVALHDHWPDVHPLLKDFPIDTVLPPLEGDPHVFRPTIGEGVFAVPVGPVHAGIIEPGHFHFAVAGEPVLYLQLRLFYTHKGTEKLFEHIPLRHGVHLAESVSGDTSFGHGLAWCLALERAAGIEVPPRAQAGRLILLELERIYNHVADIGAIATDVGFVIANSHATRLREQMLRLNEELTGNRLLRGLVCPGGLRQGLDAARLQDAVEKLDSFGREFEELVRLIENSDSTIDRLEATGMLSPDKARDLGIVGVAARASGQNLDVRRDHPFDGYRGLPMRVPVFVHGDVLHRMRVRVEEVRESLSLIRAVAAEMPEGPVMAPVPPIAPGTAALAAVEGWRGEILYWVRMGEHGRLDRCRIKDPSLNNWPALVEAVQGNIIPDFPVINKSFNLSYSGTDR